MTISPFLIIGAILVAAVVTVALYSLSAANAQSSNMTKTKTSVKHDKDSQYDCW